MTRVSEAAAGGPPPSTLRAWWLASRPTTLPAAIIPVVVGTAVAQRAGGAQWTAALSALAGSLLIQIGTKLANDVFDFERGADTADRVGPLRVTQAGLLSPRAVRSGAAVVFLLAALGPGLYLTAVAGWPVVVIGLLSIAAAIAYTGGPYPLAYHALGDVFVMLFFGFVAVVGTAYVQRGSIPMLAWPAALAVGALSTALLVVNNLRDIDSDARVGKRTLAVELGRLGTLTEYVALLLLAYSVPLLMFLGADMSLWSLMPLATLPVVYVRVRTLVLARDAASFDACLRGTAALMLTFSVLLAAGVLV
ncbi:MAG: 1,4-dihydroxy-2-naphthoate polyprenyltransferase [Myxococcota bacterium]